MSGALSSLGFRNIKGNYFATFTEREQASWVTDVATMLTTDAPYELYKFLGMPPVMSKWTGERKRQQLSDYGIPVVNDKYESTVEVDIDDLRRDKTGQIMARIRDMAAKAATLPQRVLTPLIEGNGTGYDGVAFYATTHSVGSSGTQINDITVSGASTPDVPTTAFMVDAILRGIQQTFLFLDDRGDPINGDAGAFTIMVPVKYWAAATAAIKNDFVTNAVTNTLKNAGLAVKVQVNPRLNGTAAAAGRRIYVFRTDANIRALLWQDEDISDGFKTLDANSDNGFWRDSAAFGAKRIGQGALGRWELSTRVNIAA